MRKPSIILGKVVRVDTLKVEVDAQRAMSASRASESRNFSDTLLRPARLAAMSDTSMSVSHTVGVSKCDSVTLFRQSDLAITARAKRLTRNILTDKS